MRGSFKLKGKAITFVFWFFIILSLAIRLVNINSPLFDTIHAFRQTQTAITIQTFVRDGIKVFNYETPLFGPPWKVPFEFPVFQITAAVLAKSGIGNIDTAGRVTNIFFFYISALFLYLILKIIFKEHLPPVFILFYYLFNPFTIIWSRTCMIDYCSVAFSLGFLVFFIKWLENKKTLFSLNFYISIVMGIFAYLTKITTVLAFIPVMIGFSAYYVVDKHIDKGSTLLPDELSVKTGKLIALLCIVFIIPLVFGYGWVLYTDYVKNASPFTVWLTSKNLTEWNYGTIRQRLETGNWLKVIKSLHSIVPGFFIFFLPIGVWYALRDNKKIALFFFFSFFGIVFEISVFFNLFTIHDYYLMAVSPLVSVIIGFSVYAFFCKLVHRKRIVLIASIVIITLTTLPDVLARLTFPLVQNIYPPKITLPDFIKTVTADNEYVVIADFDWNPRILYYAERKGFMLRDKYTPEMGELFKKHNFTTILTRTSYPELMSNWRYSVEIESKAFNLMRFHVFKVTDSLETLNKWKHQYGFLNIH
ncbi:MAG: hypothetical protein H7844_08255 [Nitrospirae bacterium YQR-1]